MLPDETKQLWQTYCSQFKSGATTDDLIDRETQYLRGALEVDHLSSIVKYVVTNKLLMSLKLFKSA